MVIIKNLSEMISEELEGAEHYAKCAIKHREDHPTLAKTMYDIATDEMRHVDLLHTEVVKIIKAYREKSGEPPAAMMAVYEYLHEKQIEEAAEVKMLLAQYREA